ncbi:MAG: L-histidine N(alpha)-methyltransferase [Nocardioidaceae bacterium]
MSDPTIEVHLSDDHAAKALRHDVRAGLSASPKWLPPKWFYDARGSELFEEITRLPEYYPTRAEAEALREAVPEIASLTKAHTIVELGAGSSEKTPLLLDALSASGSLQAFVPQDVSTAALEATAEAIASDYPDLRVHGVVSDFTADLGRLPGESPRLVAFLGGTIGNFDPAERRAFLHSVADVLEPGEWLLLGTDLVKDERTLVAAYDDAQGVTAEFNRNVLHVINRELSADFDVQAFEHVAVWNADQEWIEMRLRAERDMRVGVEALQMSVDFASGEEMRTEISAKFREAGVRRELAAAGLDVQGWWTDEAGRFGLALAQRVAR